MRTWQASDMKAEKYLGTLEIENGDCFEIIKTKTKLVFGSMCNAGLLESGYMILDGRPFHEELQELVEELETYYRDGKQYCNRIICNSRM